MNVEGRLDSFEKGPILAVRNPIPTGSWVDPRGGHRSTTASAHAEQTPDGHELESRQASEPTRLTVARAGSTTSDSASPSIPDPRSMHIELHSRLAGFCSTDQVGGWMWRFRSFARSRIDGMSTRNVEIRRRRHGRIDRVQVAFRSVEQNRGMIVRRRRAIWRVRRSWSAIAFALELGRAI